MIKNRRKAEKEHMAVIEIEKIIKNMPTAFDNEKVIDEIRERIGACDGSRCKEYGLCDECRAEEAVKIIEKGGIK